MTSLMNKIQNWINAAIETQAWERADDIHIDEIDPVFSDKTRWVEDALTVGKIFADLILDTPYIVLLGIHLTYSETPTPISELGWRDIQNGVSYSPPSFYLFPRNNEDLAMTLAGLRHPQRLNSESSFPVFFREEFEEGEGYLRIVFMLLG